MCGIFGFIGETKQGDKEVLSSMALRMRHRGPDAGNYYIDSNAALGHVRLSIVDLSENASQPMFNKDKSTVLVCNGEIYNFRELKNKLSGLGYSFISDSDNEVILHLWSEYGEDCVSYLKGMFSFGIWDLRQKVFFGATDRAGKKPFYYTFSEDTFYFASEPKAFIDAGIITPEVNYSAVHNYLTYQAVPAPETIYKDVYKLPKASVIKVCCGKTEINKYWELDYSRKLDLTEEEWFEAIDEKLITSVKRRLMSDVPLGAFLSGGLDSSVITALMANLMDEPVKTFSIGFEEKDYSELEYARQVADIFNTDHQELTVKAQDGSFLLKLAEYFNEPFADPAMIPTYFLSGMAKERVTVALNGDAGDENFAGYPRYVKNSDNYPWFINNKDINNFSLFKGMDSPEKKITAENISYYQRLIHFGEWDKDKMYSEEMKGITDSFCSAEIMMNLLNSLGSASDVDRMTFADFGLYLPEVLMVKVDFASMAHSLEVRSPMLDHEFMELCASIPSELKLKNGEVTKYILKKYSEKYLPDNIIYRNKMGFGVPLDYWFRNEMKELLVDTLTSSKALSRGYFRPEFIKELIEEHMGGRNRQYQLYNLLMLEIWHNIFIDGISHG